MFYASDFRGVAKAALGRRIHASFVAGSDAPVHLLLEASAVRPGTQFQVAVDNGSSGPIQHGTFNHIEAARSGRRVPINGPYVFTAQAFAVSPGTVGPCITVAVPSTTPPGAYRVVVQGVGGWHNSANPGLSAEFQVRGSPLPHPTWEVRLSQAAEENRHRRQFDALETKAPKVPPALESPRLCPRISSSGLEIKRLAGKSIPRAPRLAKRYGCTVRVVERDHVSLPVTQDLRSDRINVAVRGGSITRVLLVG
jgi:hypothetical protein